MEPSEGLRSALLDLQAAMSIGDADAVASEFWTAPVRHNADVRPYFDDSVGRARWRAGSSPVALAQGSASWTAERPAVTLPDGPALSLRFTFAWRREEGAWRVVHPHASLGQA